MATMSASHDSVCGSAWLSVSPATSSLRARCSEYTALVSVPIGMNVY
uniref:Uncharacterized protein n=1 Tax=Anguilla anguilla TaxID=7936 RepID=A0A0E9V0V7_ANGAN